MSLNCSANKYVTTYLADGHHKNRKRSREQNIENEIDYRYRESFYLGFGLVPGCTTFSQVQETAEKVYQWIHRGNAKRKR